MSQHNVVTASSVTAQWAWAQRAACRDLNTEQFYGPDGETRAEKEFRETRVKRVCLDHCPVRQACLDHAIAAREAGGIWGGLNQDERDSEKRRRTRRAA